MEHFSTGGSRAVFLRAIVSEVVCEALAGSRVEGLGIQQRLPENASMLLAVDPVTAWETLNTTAPTRR